MKPWARISLNPTALTRLELDLRNCKCSNSSIIAWTRSSTLSPSQPWGVWWAGFPAQEAHMGFLHPLNFSVEEEPMVSTETEMSVLVLSNFRVRSTLKSDLIQSRARLHICCLLAFPYQMCLIYMKKKIVPHPAWHSGRGSLGSER